VVSGTDVALKSADIILVRRNLNVIPDAIALGPPHAAHHQAANLVWAFGYNMRGDPAGGVRPAQPADRRVRDEPVERLRGDELDAPAPVQATGRSPATTTPAPSCGS
jgi:hypothetical protein